MKKSNKLKKYYLSLEILLITISAISFYPVFLLAVDSFKTRSEMTTNPFGFPSSSGFTLENIINSFYKMKFYQPLFNSIVITSISSVLIILVSALAAYPIARKNNKLYNFFYMFFLAGIMIPYQLAIITLYKEMRVLNLMNKEIGLILVYGGIFLSFPIFFYSSFIKTVPIELEEAAIIDGCGRYRVFMSIVFPLLKPATATIAVLNMLGIWNEFTLSFLFLQKPSKITITVATYTFKGEFHTNWPSMFSGLFIAVVPVIILFLSVQKYYIRGITAGALKG